MSLQWYKFRSETLELDSQARQNAGGAFIELPEGFTHYELAGDPNAQPIVLVHGFSVPHYIWDRTFSPLVEAGFYVLRYTLFGRGFSDRPKANYNHNLFERQLLHLLEALNVQQPVNLVGLSMGGAITTAFTARHPDQVRRLALIDPAGFPMKGYLAKRVLTIPLIGEWIMDLLGDRFLVAGQSADLNDPSQYIEYIERYRHPMKYRGFKRALLSTMRSEIIEGSASYYQQVGKNNCPVLLIWGTEDETVPFSISQQVLKAIPQAEFHPIQNSRHIPHIEYPEIVNPILIDFFRG